MRLPLVPILAALALALALAATGCGGGGGKDKRLTLTTPKGSATPRAETTAEAAAGRGKRVTREEDATIRGWADALRHGQVGRAVGYWAVPAVVSNGEPPAALTSRAEVLVFNQALPCGAKVQSTRRDPNDRRFVVAVFVLTERPGAGQCGGVGQRARTAFLIKHHRIVQWLRLADPAAQEDSASS